MADYSQTDLDNLLTCEKEIVVAPKRDFVIVNASKRKDMRVAATDGRLFSVFMRINEDFEECFSIGLLYLPSSGSSVTLLRCNGPHGGFAKSLTELHPHFGFHVHKASEESVREGRDAVGTLTKEYGDYAGALKFFLKTVNIKWNDSVFPGLTQKSLPFLGPDEDS